jgi:glycosyltransferase involved in cell wall biosynthesis
MKNNKSIWVNCLVRNEEKWIWFALMSVINHVDKILVWDTGSTDETVDIIKGIKNPKIEFKEYGSVTKETYPQARQAMLEATKADWLFILDGDEIWTDDGIRQVIDEIQKSEDDLESIVVKTINFVGDVYHYQEEQAGKYEIAGHKGHLNLRAMNLKIPGLHAAGSHGVQGYFDGENKPIQERNSKNIVFLPVSYFHATHLQRSSAIEKEKEVPLRANKRKYELGISLPENTVYPEVFYLERPEDVPNPWGKMSKLELLRSAIQTPFKKIKRTLSK